MSASLPWINWKVPIGLAELLAFVDVRQDDVERGLHEAERPGGQHHALVVEAAHQHVDALADLAEHGLRRNFAVGEYELGGVGAAHAELVELGPLRKALHAALDDEGGDAARARGGIGLGVDDEGLGEGTVGDPHLRAIDDVAVALALGAGGHRDDVRARVRLRHRQRADMLAGDEFGQIARLLRVIAVAHDLVDAEVGMRAVGQPDRAARRATLPPSRRNARDSPVRARHIPPAR